MAMAGVSPQICILCCPFKLISFSNNFPQENCKKFWRITLVLIIYDNVTKLKDERDWVVFPRKNPWRVGACIFPWTVLVMKSAYRSVMFYIGQKELEMQYKMNRIVAQCRQKCELMQEKFTEKLEQVHTAYQKMAKRCQMMEQEIESMSKDKQELQEKFSEKSRWVVMLIIYVPWNSAWCLDP